jgi:hypothetical protein
MVKLEGLPKDIINDTLGHGNISLISIFKHDSVGKITSQQVSM